jgi:histidinol-phosphate/aromatic aminotransferase/cobyric acid decarboxylase-like protein
MTGFSRRNLFRSMLATGAALPFQGEFALAQLSMVSGAPADAVMINANENPMGPCAEAAEAIHNVVQKGGRYMWDQTSVLESTLAEQEGVKPSYVLAYPGSSLPLHHAVLAFTGANKSFVTGDPGYEAGERAADFIGAKVHRVPLRSDYSHDVRKMAAADPNAGLIYVCNPNNPTGSLTSRADLEWLVANKPAGCVVMIDEAYIHIAGNQPSTDLVAADKDLIVLRTFSKLYGMAGLRAGAAIARPDLLGKIRPLSAGALPITGVMGATASLRAKNVVPERRKTIKDIREDTLAFLDAHRFKFVPSVSNKFMVDGGRPGKEVIRAMAAQKVYIGRVWPSWPTYVRVTVGSREDMARFKDAWLKVMSA